MGAGDEKPRSFVEWDSKPPPRAGTVLEGVFGVRTKGQHFRIESRRVVELNVRVYTLAVRHLRPYESPA